MSKAPFLELGYSCRDNTLSGYIESRLASIGILFFRREAPSVAIGGPDIRQNTDTKGQRNMPLFLPTVLPPVGNRSQYNAGYDIFHRRALLLLLPMH